MCPVGRRGGHAFMRFNLKEWHYKVSLRWDSCQKVDHQATSKNFSWFLVLWGYVRTENKRFVFYNHPKQVKIDMISTCGLWALGAGVGSRKSKLYYCNLIFLLSQRSLVLGFFWINCQELRLLRGVNCWQLSLLWIYESLYTRNIRLAVVL